MADKFTIPRPEGVTADVALLLHGLGLSIFPVPLPVAGTPANHPGDGKTPASGFSWKRWQTERASADMVREWFGHSTNVAIVTGAISDLVVVDCDSEPALHWATRHLPYTPRQVRTAKGYHLSYRHPGVPVRNKARIDTGDGKMSLDLRADGGYVIGPWSLHASGETYHAVGDWDAPASEVPVFNPAWLTTAPKSLATTSSEPRTYTTATPVLDRARKYLASIPRPEIGCGSDAATLYAACRLARGFELPEGDAVMLLDEWAGGRPGWDRGWLATKVRHAMRYGAEPIGGLL